MRTLCVYCTRSGLTEAIARQTAAALNADLLCISDGHAYRGIGGYFRAAVRGLRKRLPALRPYTLPAPAESYDRIVAAAPIWCENVSPILRAFLRENREKLTGDVHIIVTHMSPLSYADRIKALETVPGKPPVSFLSVQTHKHDYAPEVDAYLRTLTGENGGNA